MEFVQGEDLILAFEWWAGETEETATRVDLTGAALRMQIRLSRNAEDSILDLDDGAAGGLSLVDDNFKIRLHLTAAKTDALPARRLVYDLEVDLSGVTINFLRGYIKPARSATRSATS